MPAIAADSIAGKKPNIVFILTDDQGYGDLSCHGNPVLQTPNIDRLHAEGVRFTDFHVSPTCSPTRAARIGQSYPGSCGDAPGNSYFSPTILHNGTFVRTTGYCTDVFFGQALSWIKSVKGREPFFCYIATNRNQARQNSSE
jgi:hypothetical protein